MLAIHDSERGFHPHWVRYCEREGIPFRKVDCYANDVINTLEGCDCLMWHHSHSNARDALLARGVLFALEHAGIRVFPNFLTAWHFDDKVSQKYLFEALKIPTVPAYVFVDRVRALDWVEQTDFPKVFKLRRGAGSAGVRLVRNRRDARQLIRRAFGSGFRLYDPWERLKERAYKVGIGKVGLMSLVKGLARFVYPPRFARILGREVGYVYFQDFVPHNDSDVRVIVIGTRAFGIRRLVRPGDFRASGSGRIRYGREDVSTQCVELAFEISKKLASDCVALDFVFDIDRNPLVLEISYGFIKEVYDECEGYWDSEMIWHEGPFDPQGWMIELVRAS